MFGSGCFGCSFVQVGESDDFSARLAESVDMVLGHAARSDDSYFSAHSNFVRLGEKGFYWFSLSNAESKATVLGGKSKALTKAEASVAPWTRSMRMSSHSTESGPW